MASSWATFFFTLPFIIIVSLVPVSYAALSVSDRLIRLEYASHREDWERDGRPWGPYWRPPGIGTLEQQWRFRHVGHMLASQERLYGWLFKTPDWIRQDREALRLIFKLRVLMLVLPMGILGAFFFFFLGIAINLAAQLA